jgi:hypothetical protein
MTGTATDHLMMTGRRLLRLARALHRMTRLDGTLTSYQDMLVDPLCRLTSILDSLAPSPPYGTGRAVTSLAWHPSDDEIYGSDPAPRPSYVPEALSRAPVASPHGTTVVQGANAPVAQSGSQAQAVTNSATPPALTPLPEAYLMSKQMGWHMSAQTRRAALPTASGSTPGITRRGRASAGDSPLRPPSTSWSASALTSAPRTHIAADEALETRLRPSPASAALRPERGWLPASLMGDGQDGVARLEAKDSRDTSPGPHPQRRAAPPAEPEPGSVRLSRGGASLMSILRHNLAPGQASVERQATGFSPDSNSAPEGTRNHSGTNLQRSLENRGGHGGLLQHHDAPDAWGSGEAPQQLSSEHIEQIIDALAEQLEMALLRTYGTTRR